MKAKSSRAPIIFLLAWMIYSCMAVNAQTLLSGRITNTKGEALSRINILVYLPDNRTLLAFAVSDGNGAYSVKVNAGSDSLLLKVTSVNYANITRTIRNTSQILSFGLTEEAKVLEGITVMVPSIRKYGDTLSYLVQSFSQKEDRTIEDILRRMPGIEVEPSGRILYQDVPISKFYVEGLDLMEGRYALVSKNLPGSAVSAVEILENHQPVRMLEEKVRTQQAALNLKIQKGITTTGTARLAAGAGPFLWDVNITPMTFTRKFQLVTSLQSNNTGNDVSQQLMVLTAEDAGQAYRLAAEMPGMLNIVAAAQPEIKTDRYLDNRIIMFNINALQRLSNDVSLRSNVYATYDRQQQLASEQRTLYLPADTLHFFEQFDNQLTARNVYARFNINRNVKKNYLNNDLKFRAGWDRQSGLAAAGNKEVTQLLNNPVESFSNELRSFHTIGKHIWDFQSLLSYDNNPHSLEISPGQFENVLNEGKNFGRVIQKLRSELWLTNNSAGLVLSRGAFTLSPRLGMAFRQKSLRSSIQLQETGTESIPEPQFSNNLRSETLLAYGKAELEYKYRKLTLKGSGTLTGQQVKITDTMAGKDQQVYKNLFDSRISADYRVSGFWRFSSSWTYERRMSDYDEMHSGYIIRNYRNLSNYLVPLTVVTSHRIHSRLEYRNQIIAFFNTLNYSYSVSHSDYIASSRVNADGSSVSTNEFIPRTSRIHYLQAYSSKYIPKTKTTVSLRVNLIQQQGTSLINSELFGTRSRVINVKPELSFHITPWMNLEYALDANTILTYINAGQRNRIALNRHNVSFFVFPSKNQLFSISSEYYNRSNTGNLFVDLLYRYTVTKRKVDLELKCSNIFNSRSYTSLMSNAFAVLETTYTLRPFQVLAAVKFAF